VESRADAEYRLELARGFLREAEQDLALGRWRSAVNSAQLTVENAAQGVISQRCPAPKTHQVAQELRLLLQETGAPPERAALLTELTECAEVLGRDVHIRTDYGDEVRRVTPWALFSQEDAEQALGHARRAVSLVAVILGVPSGDGSGEQSCV